MTAELRRALALRAAAPYRPKGRFAWHFARGKLRHDPAFSTLLRLGLFADPVRVLDVGCGQALLAHWLAAAAQVSGTALWPRDWPPVALCASYNGIELMADDVRRSEGTLPPNARVTCADMRTAAFPPSERIVMLDVLHYIAPEAQSAVLDKARDALTPGGRLILRIGDSNAGWRARYSRWVDQAVMLGRGRARGRLHCRPLEAWVALLEARGLRPECLPPDTEAGFANRILVAQPAR